MLLGALGDLPPREQQAVIINVGTKVFTTLALMSALRHAEMPVLIVDCESADGSREHFAALMEAYEFDLVAAPLRKHGRTLDWLFGQIAAETVLLIDSDAEILDREIIGLMRRSIAHQRVFGSGFVHGPSWLLHHPGIGYYQERPWMPLAMFRAVLVREALASGRSFIARKIYNDFAPSALLSHILAARFRVARFRNSKLAWLNAFKRDYYGHKPSYVYCDTGAEIYQYLRHQRGYEFAGLPWVLHPPYVAHIHGVTRLHLHPTDPNGTHPEDALPAVRQRLKDAYGIA